MKKNMEYIVRCPVCRETTHYHADNPYRPFCSERCRLIDLGQWLEEDYRVAGDSVPNEEIENDENNRCS
jgi:endogenous inhibitor of DNA gyrase (YacG/DUF329 family)